MANTTVRGALSIHGKNPQFLVERVIRGRIYESIYWKEHCFALTAATIIDKALELNYVGGTYANLKPTEFICLTLKLLQIQPERAIILEYLKAEEYKYLRALAAFYIRLTFDPLNAYQVLEPLLEDYRKIRYRSMDGHYSITTIDQFIDSLLRDERVCDIQLPRLTQRRVLEETDGLPERSSKLGRAILGERSVTPEEERFVSVSPEVSDDEEEERYVSQSPELSGDEGEGGENGRDHKSLSPERFISQSPEPSE